MKRILVTISAVFMIGIILQPVFQLTIMEWTNLTFLISLISFLLAACLTIVASGFLDYFFQGFIRLNNVIFRKPRALEKIDENYKHSSDMKNLKETMTKIFIQQAILIGMCTLLLSIIGVYLT